MEDSAGSEGATSGVNGDGGGETFLVTTVSAGGGGGMALLGGSGESGNVVGKSGKSDKGEVSAIRTQRDTSALFTVGLVKMRPSLTYFSFLLLVFGLVTVILTILQALQDTHEIRIVFRSNFGILFSRLSSGSGDVRRQDLGPVLHRL